MEEMFERAEGHWLVLKYDGVPGVRLDARVLDRILAHDDNLVLSIDGFVLELPLLSGPTAARNIAQDLALFTRTAPITRVEAYDDAKRRLELTRRGRTENGALVLFVGDKDVYASADWIYIGDVRVCSIEELIDRAEQGKAIQMGGHVVRAAIVLLLLAAKRRAIEDPAVLSRRIREYERSASRE